jgi:hypothetical protein
MREIAPLLKNRRLYAESEHFVLYDLWKDDGTVDEDVYAYSNRRGEERAVILFHNRYAQTSGTIHWSADSMDKGSGQLRRRQLAEALGIHQGAGRVVAWKDGATGLEYLRHAWQIEREGLRFDLRAYQYAVLGEWRELQSTTEQPWDRLCDALQGAGVYRLDEALATLRLRPVHEALRAALAPPVLRDAVLALGQRRPRSMQATADALEEVARTISLPDSEEPAAALAPQLAIFADRVEAFLRLAQETLSEGHSPTRQAVEAQFRGLALPFGDEVEAEPALEGLAPVFAWAALRLLPGKVADFDALHLRKGLAEIFPSLGIEGEAAWRAAALVRLLLGSFDGETPPENVFAAESFWTDADTCWLLGVNEYQGKRFLDRERLAMFLKDLCLMGVLTSPEAAEIEEKASGSGYEVRSFLVEPEMEKVPAGPVSGIPKPDHPETPDDKPDDGEGNILEKAEEVDAVTSLP